MHAEVTKYCSWDTMTSPGAAEKYKKKSAARKPDKKNKDGKGPGSARISGMSSLRDNSEAGEPLVLSCVH